MARAVRLAPHLRTTHRAGEGIVNLRLDWIDTVTGGRRPARVGASIPPGPDSGSPFSNARWRRAVFFGVFRVVPVGARGTPTVGGELRPMRSFFQARTGL